MIKDLIRSIMRENAAESEEDLMASNCNSDIRDAFIGEDGEFDDTSEVTDSKIKDLIKNLPESNANLTQNEIAELSESYLDVFDDADYALESSVSIDVKIAECERIIESACNKESLTEEEQEEVKGAKKKLSALNLAKEKKGEDLDMETLDESNTVDIDLDDDENILDPNEEEGKAMTLDITEGLDDYDIDLEADETDETDGDSKDDDTKGSKSKKKKDSEEDKEDNDDESTKESAIDLDDILFEESLYADDEPIHDKYNPKKDGSAGVNGKDKYADDQWINDIGVDESGAIDLTDLDNEF